MSNENNTTPGAHDVTSASNPDTHEREGTARSSRRGKIIILRALALIALILLLGGIEIKGTVFLSAPPPHNAINIAVTEPHNPYTHTGTLVLNDALNGKRNPNGWDQGSTDSNASCLFEQGTYHVTEATPGFFHGCIAHASHYNNFVYQVQMTLLHEGAGGILFRTDLARSQAYYFSIYVDSSYAFWVFDQQSGGNAHKLTRTGSMASAFHAGLSQTNTLAVVANGSSLDLYVNLKHLAAFHDLTLRSGQIGVFAENDGAPMEVMYSNAKVWLL